jgi:glycosyltransferase involved in cell wall biosynthesis
MKINIIFEFKDGPYGGGNQFLKSLRKKFIENGFYTEEPKLADIFIFNSFQDINKVLKIKRKYPNKLFVHRVDGPISLYRNSSDRNVDNIIYKLNDSIADATIYQSKFSLEENKKLGIKKNIIEEIIYNAPDNSIFYPRKKKLHDFKNIKIKLISTSWSSNIMKGFETYRYLDENLDFSRYEYAFIGNSPIEFKNIKIIPPRTSSGVAELLRNSDIFITASKKDPCSNSLIEALSCGLPAVVLNDGGHPELLSNGGEIFNNNEEIIEKIEKILKNYDDYITNIPKFEILDVYKKYLDIIIKLHEMQNKKEYHSKKYSFLDNFKIIYFDINEKIREKLKI